MLEVSYAYGAQGPRCTGGQRGTGAPGAQGPQGHRGPRYTGAPGALRDLRSPIGWSLGVVKMTPLSQKNIVFQ